VTRAIRTRRRPADRAESSEKTFHGADDRPVDTTNRSRSNKHGLAVAISVAEPDEDLARLPIRAFVAPAGHSVRQSEYPWLLDMIEDVSRQRCQDKSQVHRRDPLCAGVQ